jgi:hypothetical protein
MGFAFFNAHPISSFTNSPQRATDEGRYKLFFASLKNRLLRESIGGGGVWKKKFIFFQKHPRPLKSFFARLSSVARNSA